ncbi:phage tail-collar fiber domain-containing protein [Limnobaculum xujianqingii]|uniref:phage tail-collar fiber domain-containing protein n=1 Tax=Limnobaculum xujianqingii TaxID=2738837 RepID=UPI00112D34E0|nr:phage tail protein [Limnobaculum xujianqingii]
MATAITTAFEHWNATQVMNGLPARPNKIVFAYIPGLDPVAAIDRTAGLPAAEYIVYQSPVMQYGLINENAVAYSVVLDTTVGNFDFNYLGLLDEESGTLCMVVHTMTQSKIATADGTQGNSFTRTFLMEFDGAAESSQITVTAETWQIDYSARLAGMDERIRLSNIDMFGHASFDGFSVTREGEQFRVDSGVAYIGGIRIESTEPVFIDAPADSSVWVDVSYQGAVTGAWEPRYHFVIAASQSDYVDAHGFHHYVAQLAFEVDTIITDTRESSPFNELKTDINKRLTDHEQSTNHPDATSTRKGFVMLDSSVDSAGTSKAATPKAVKAAYDLASSKVLTVNGRAADGDKNVLLTAPDVNAVPADVGGSFGGEISATYKNGLSFAEQYMTKAAFYNDVSRPPASEFWPVLKQRFHIPGFSAYVYSLGALNSANGQSTFTLNITNSGGGGKNFTWAPNGDYVIEGTVQAGEDLRATRHVYAGFNQGYLRNDGMVGGPVWGGTINAWMYANFVSGVRLAGRVNISDTGGRIDLPSGTMYTGMSGANYNPAYWGAYSHLQYLINGTWVNAGTV